MYIDREKGTEEVTMGALPVGWLTLSTGLTGAVGG